MRLRLILPLIALLFIIAPADAQTKSGLTVAQALSMLQAHRVLDGHSVIVKQNGADTAVLQPWEFGSGTLRFRLAKNTAALAEIEQGLDTARRAIVKELLKGMPEIDGKKPTSIDSGSPQFAELQRQFGEALDAPASVSLFRIKVSEFKLDKNEIPVTALSALEPILDDDSGDGAKSAPVTAAPKAARSQ
jgi:hypothetical protein